MGECALAGIQSDMLTSLTCWLDMTLMNLSGVEMLTELVGFGLSGQENIQIREAKCEMDREGARDRD